MASLDLTNKFIKGLTSYNLTFDEIQNGAWKYCGGTKGQHLNYFKLLYKNSKLPMNTDKCVCGHTISENCYITDGKRLLILGNCCIKKFIPKNTRTCEKCGEIHKNRIVNRCNYCRLGICDICNKKCDSFYRKCYNCQFKK